jgi:hypothetical protein
MLCSRPVFGLRPFGVQVQADDEIGVEANGGPMISPHKHNARVASLTPVALLLGISACTGRSPIPAARGLPRLALLPASTFKAGDHVDYRFYSYITGQSGVFKPGPTASTWFPAFMFRQPPTTDCPTH